jgi:CO/xanthine dehydrogenase FAD-binding subunit
VLQKGELLRRIHLPVAALSKRTAMRQVSLTRFGRSAALIIATVGDDGADFLLTVSAATPRPVQLRFATCPSAEELRHALDTRLPPGAYFDDVHGSAPYKRHVTQYLAEQIRTELA